MSSNNFDLDKFLMDYKSIIIIIIILLIFYNTYLVYHDYNNPNVKPYIKFVHFNGLTSLLFGAFYYYMYLTSK